MDYIGTGKRLQAGDIGYAAKQVGIETAVLLAFIEVEAAGRGFDNSNRPKMLFEPHIFYRELTGAQKAAAVAAGLAYASWKPGAYPPDSYPRLKAATAINSRAAHRSASYGLGQIMGFNHEDAGFPDPESMVRAAMRGEREQLLQMVTLLKNWNMVSLLTGKDFTKADSWRAVAKRYNGSGYAKHGYHVKLAEAYRKHSKKNVDMKSVKSPYTVLRKGVRGEQVRNMQADLASLGYVFTKGIDGRYGDETYSIVKAYQKKKNIGVDGIAGAETLGHITVDLAKMKNDLSPSLSIWKEQTETGWFIALLKRLFT